MIRHNRRRNVRAEFLVTGPFAAVAAELAAVADQAAPIPPDAPLAPAVELAEDIRQSGGAS